MYEGAKSQGNSVAFFSTKTLTLVAETQELRRYHLHRSHVQKAIKGAYHKGNMKLFSQKR